MQACRSCGREIPLDSRLCPYCAVAAAAALTGPTITAQPRMEREALPSHATSSSGSIDDARFTPGTMLTERYRIVGLLGKGGMGEVYRADDLKLRQPVALKFLPAALSGDPSRLERFHHEVRVARHVSHPNVCRVYDIAEIHGQTFLSMEYVDGEDLASVLRRMGPPSQDKAVQIARQLCAGLAAAHDKGVLHRDLKPHNVMIDGQGKVRITDFGLAGFAEELAGKDVNAGTPAYMAPEQLAGRSASVKSDLYSLGLVLYELFTGERAFKGTSRAEIARLQTEQSPTGLSTTRDIDPAVERVILRCLEREPAARPSSALAVAAALPGGDPLAAALAAGETPDPAMVAAAGEIGGLRPAVAIAALFFVAAGLVAYSLLNSTVSVIRLTPLPLSPELLAFRASETLKAVGYDTRPTDRANGFWYATAYYEHIKKADQSPDRWQRLSKARPEALWFWYRESPRQLQPQDSLWAKVNFRDPPFILSGMANVLLAPDGRLSYLEVIPPQRDERAAPETPSAAVDWSPLFKAAGLDQGDFTPAAPQWNPLTTCEQRAAWTGLAPGSDDLELRIEAGAYAGKANYFDLIYPWTRPWRMEESTPQFGEKVSTFIFIGLMSLVLVAAGVITWRNLRLRRGDRSGAFRVAVAYFCCNLLAWALWTDHVTSPVEEFTLVVSGLAWTLSWSAWVWLLYIAVEPYVRRIWPQILVSWARLISGRWKDPLVGRDILFGVTLGVVAPFLRLATFWSQRWVGAPPMQPHTNDTWALIGGRHVWAWIVDPGFVNFGLAILFVLLGLRFVFRNRHVAIVAFVLLVTGVGVLESIGEFRGIGLVAMVLMGITVFGIFLATLLRFGLLGLIACGFVDRALSVIPMTVDFSAWYVESSLIAMFAIVAIAAFACYTAMAGRPLFRDDILGS